MRKLYVKMARFVREEDAPTAVEYGVMVALIAAVVILGAGQIGAATEAVFEAVATVIGGL
jgi:pilus assembly protein Flp/PilA